VADRGLGAWHERQRDGHDDRHGAAKPQGEDEADGRHSGSRDRRDAEAHGGAE